MNLRRISLTSFRGQFDTFLMADNFIFLFFDFFNFVSFRSHFENFGALSCYFFGSGGGLIIFVRVYSCKLITFILKIFLFSDFLIYFVLGVNLSLFGLHRVELEMGSIALLGLYS